MSRYADNFEAACPLDSLSWVSMAPGARLGKLAARFLKDEPNIRRFKEKGDWAVTAGTVRPWLFSVYEPPRGQVSGLIDALLVEITRQRKLREERAKNPPWTWPKLKHQSRLNSLSQSFYGIISKDWNDKDVVEENFCNAITTFSGVLMLQDVRPEANVRIFMRHRETGHRKVVITTDRVGYGGGASIIITQTLLKMAPPGALRSMFSGARLSINFDQNGFDIDGALYPWRNVICIVEGDEVMRTPKRPKKPADESAGH